MTFTNLRLAFVFTALLGSAYAFAAAPDGPYGSNGHPAADMKWSYDGTRDAIFVNLKHSLAGEKNSFGPVAGGNEDAVPEDSEWLADFVPHILGIPGPEVKLQNDRCFYSGAEPHNATREVAVITQGRRGEIVALAVLQGNYISTPAVKELTILVPAGKPVDPSMEAIFTGWARGEIDRSNAILQGSPLSTIVDKLVVQTRSIGG